MMPAVCSASTRRAMRSEVDVVAASIRKNFAANLTSILEELRARGILQREVAEALDVSTQQISQWKSAASLPEPETVQRLAELAGLDDPGLLYADPANFIAYRLESSRHVVDAVKDLSISAKRVADLVGIGRRPVRKS